MKVYPAYKESEIRWIGQIPIHWDCIKLKYSDNVIMGQSPSSYDYNLEQIGHPFLQGNADFSALHPIPRVWCDTANKTAQKDDVLLSVRAPIGAVNISDQNYGIGRGLCAIKAERTNPKLLFYLFTSLHEELNSNGTGSTYTAISADIVRNTFVPNIPLPEQDAISDFLDCKTTKIGEMIAKKQCQIDLLHEQRAALINQTVTKGLPPSPCRGGDGGEVQMKPSGVEWLEEIPEHWKMVQLKFAAPRKTDQTSDVKELGLQIALENIESGTGKLLNNGSFEGIGNIFRKGDVLFNKLRPYLNKVVISPDTGVAVSELLVLRPEDNVDSGYLFYRLLDSQFISIVDGSTYGAKMPRANWDFIGNLKVPIPPLLEQQAITDFLDRKTAQLEAQIALTVRQIAFLQEYRTALIYAAVTGKIDVREGS